MSKKNITDVAPDLLRSWINDGSACVIDVREDFEHAEERIDGASLHCLSKFDASELRSMHGDQRLVFHCRSGKRSADAAGRFADGEEAVFHLAGGIEGWKASGLPTLKPDRASGIPIMRQVQIAAGGLVTIGVILGVTASPWFLVLPAFVGSGLMFAGTTGWCGMAMLLGRMPWNRGPSCQSYCPQ